MHLLSVKVSMIYNTLIDLKPIKHSTEAMHCFKKKLPHHYAKAFLFIKE